MGDGDDVIGYLMQPQVQASSTSEQASNLHSCSKNTVQVVAKAPVKASSRPLGLDHV